MWSWTLYINWHPSKGLENKESVSNMMKFWKSGVAWTWERPAWSARKWRKRSLAPQSLPSKEAGSDPDAIVFSNVDLTAPRGFDRKSYAGPTISEFSLVNCFPCAERSLPTQYSPVLSRHLLALLRGLRLTLEESKKVLGSCIVCCSTKFGFNSWQKIGNYFLI